MSASTQRGSSAESVSLEIILDVGYRFETFYYLELISVQLQATSMLVPSWSAAYGWLGADRRLFKNVGTTNMQLGKIY